MLIEPGTPEGVHVSTNHRGGEEKDDSVYHSDLSLDSDPESLPMDVATTTIATATTTENGFTTYN